jgi:ribosomal protein S18 acetylase RimI-like enzyme
VHIALRPSLPEDQAFLLAVYISTRQDELAAVPWDQATKDAFLHSQARAQDADYRSRRPAAEFLIVTVDGEDVGRLYRAELPDDDLRLMDIALLPAWRGRGIGTKLIEDLIAEAQRARQLVSLHVELHNPVRRLYDRLGFVVTGQDAVYALMELRPS